MSGFSWQRIPALFAPWLVMGALVAAVPTPVTQAEPPPPTAAQKQGEKPPAKQASPGRKATPGKPGSQPRRRTPRTGDSSSLKKREERLARNHIAAAYPRTVNLLGYLARRDRGLFDDVLSHSRKITRRQEAAALAMARKHHPELARLIVQLRSKFPRAYDTAIRDLVSDAALIKRAETRGKRDYELALTEWKLRSQARLVAARMTVKNQPELTKQLESILTQGEAAKRRQMQLEIERHERQIQRLRRRLEQDSQRNVRLQLRKIQRQARARAKTSRRRK